MERHLNWLNLNSQRKYPFCDDTSLRLPINFIVDINLVLPSNIEVPVYVSKLIFHPITVSVEISDKNGTVICATTCCINSEEYSVAKFVSFVSICTGFITVYNKGFFDYLSTLESPIIDLYMSDTEILPSCTEIISSDYITNVYVENYIEPINDFVELNFDRNIFYTRKETNTVYVGLKDATQFESNCRQKGAWYDRKRCRPIEIQQLNNVLPDENGNITLEGDGLVIFGEESGGLIVETPQVSIYDLCDNGNYNEGPPGKRGPVGIKGGGGSEGCVDCTECDCEGEYPEPCDCDKE